MQTLPANGQAQTLPGKWVIRVTEDNRRQAIEFLRCKGNMGTPEVNWYVSSEGFMFEFPPRGLEPITDSQFKAMVEGEREPARKSYTDEEREEQIKAAYAHLLNVGETDLAAALKAKHPDIWPVDYAAEVLRTSLAFYKKCYHGEKPDGLIEEVQEWMAVCRNYLQSKIEG